MRIDPPRHLTYQGRSFCDHLLGPVYAFHVIIDSFAYAPTRASRIGLTWTSPTFQNTTPCIERIDGDIAGYSTQICLVWSRWAYSRVKAKLWCLISRFSPLVYPRQSQILCKLLCPETLMIFTLVVEMGKTLETDHATRRQNGQSHPYPTPSDRLRVRRRSLFRGCKDGIDLQPLEGPNADD